MPRTPAKGLANPAYLSPVPDKSHKQTIQVVIETPKGSRNKYAFNPKLGVFELKRVLPAGMMFPYDFGFVPSTLAEDGDPVDVLVLMDEPAFAGCLATCRLIGVIRGRQKEKGKWKENDRLIAVETNNHDFARVKHLRDLGGRFLKELEEFFVNYHDLDDTKFEVLAAKGPAVARTCVEQGRRAARKK